MARPIDDEDEKPLDPAVETVRRKLVRFMVFNLGLLFVALMVVVAAIVYKSRGNTPPAVADGEVPPLGKIISCQERHPKEPWNCDPVSGEILLPAGVRVISQAISGNRISLDTELATGSRMIFIYDIAEQRMIGQFAIKSK